MLLRAIRVIAGFLVGFGVATATIGAVDRFGGDGDGTVVLLLGEPDVTGYCTRDDPAARAVQVSSAIDGRRCLAQVDGGWEEITIDMVAVCRWQHGDGTNARLVGDSVGDWRCVRNA